MEVVSGTIYKMEQCIRAKLLAAGAISREKAVTIQEAHFDMQEQNWLNYIAGGLFANVKKQQTSDITSQLRTKCRRDKFKFAQLRSLSENPKTRFFIICVLRLAL